MQKKISVLKLISIFILMFLNINLLIAEQNEPQIKKYKIYIPEFEFKNATPDDNYLKSSIPRSIRNVLMQKHEVFFSSKVYTNDELKKQGFELVLKGWMSKKDNDFKIDFFVINVETNSILILADVTGELKKMFDFIDLMGNNINRILTKNKKELLEKPEIISIDKKGVISIKQLKGSELSGINFSNINLTGLDISEANLKNSILTNSKLINTNLFRINLENANLKGADLSKANLAFANLRGADLRDANMTGSIFYKTDLSDAKMDNLGDFNIGLMTGYGAFGWFTAEYNIYKNIFLGIKIGYTQSDEKNTINQTVMMKNMPVFITANYYFLTKNAFENPTFRPYMGFGFGYRFALTGESSHGFIMQFYAGIEISIIKRLSIFAEAGVFHNGKSLYPSIGGGLKLFLPNLIGGKTNIYSNVKSIDTENAERQQQSETENAKKTFNLIAFKLGLGISTILQNADTEILENLKMKVKFSYNFGLRYFLFPKNKIGLIADLEYISLGGRQNGDIISGTTHKNYLSINALFGLKFSDLYFGIGLYFAVLLSAQANYSKPEEKEINVTEIYKRIDFGGVFTIGYIFNFKAFTMFVGLDFRISIISSYKELENVIAPQNYETRNLGVLINTGFGF